MGRLQAIRSAAVAFEATFRRGVRVLSFGAGRFGHPLAVAVRQTRPDLGRSCRRALTVQAAAQQVFSAIYMFAIR